MPVWSGTTLRETKRVQGFVGRQNRAIWPGPAPSAVTPTNYAGLQGWWDASQLGLSDAAAVTSWTDLSGNARHLTQATGSLQPLFRTSGINSLGAVDFDGTDDYLVNASAISTFIANNAYTLFAAFNVDAINTSSGTTATDVNDAIFHDASGYMGMHFDATAAPPYKVQAYNYDGTYDVNEHTVALTTNSVFMQRHDAGNLVSAINAGTETSIASGNTQVVTGTLEVGRGRPGTPYYDGKVGELIVYNVALSTTDIAALTDYLKTKWGA